MSTGIGLRLHGSGDVLGRCTSPVGGHCPGGEADNDGKSLTLFEPGAKAYAQVAAPATLEEMVDFARLKLDIVAPAGDLIVKDAYNVLMDGVTEAQPAD
jgi:hypothetical protein